MDLCSRVVFNLATKVISENYTPNGRFVGPHPYDTTVTNWDEFSNFITLLSGAVLLNKNYIDKGTYLIDITRKVIVSDEDDRVYFRSITFSNKPMSVILSTSDKLLYVSDIEPLLRLRKPEFYLKAKKFVDPRPIYLDTFDGYDVEHRPLVQNDLHNDIVIDTNLNQIWPDATGKPPVALIDLFSKTTEKVRGI